MNKITCIAIDDEPLALGLIVDYITKTPFLELCGQFDNPIDAMEFMEKTPVQLLFLDIQMPDLTGIDFGRMVDSSCKVIYITAYEKYAVEGFKVDALDYLLKPVSYEIFLKSAQRARNHQYGCPDHTKPAISVSPKNECPAFIKGRSATGGWAYATAVVHTGKRELSHLRDTLVLGAETITDFNAAIIATIDQLDACEQQIGERYADVASLIFSSHILLLKDEQFSGKMRRQIDGGIHPMTAILSVAQEYITFFQSQESPYFRQKADDIRDVTLRLLGNVAPRPDEFRGVENRVVIAVDLMPSDVLILSGEKAAGIVMIGGGATSHVAILARSLKIPLAICDVAELLELPPSARVLVDADTGNIYVNPAATVIEPFEQRIRRTVAHGADGARCAKKPQTADHVRIGLFATINLIADVNDAREVGAEGIGLYRTEFPFIIRSSFPSEEEQVVVYKKVVAGMAGLPVTFRTLDIGGDKAVPYLVTTHERNPFLGLRSMRFCLEHRDVFKSQLRAILRAGVDADLRIMYPMISSLDEFEEAQSVLRECSAELLDEHVPCNIQPVVGIMVELGAVLDIIDELAERVDFFSIGTNDLVQYILGVDRTNEHVVPYYCSHHPAVLRAIKRIAMAATNAGIEVSVCGDMAHEKRYLDFLIGVGIRTFSIDPLYFPAVHAALQDITTDGATAKAQAMLDCSRISEVAAILDRSNS